MLPLPAGEGWGGGSKVKIMPVRGIALVGIGSNSVHLALNIVLTILHDPHPGPPPLGEGVFYSSPQRGEVGRGAGGRSRWSTLEPSPSCQFQFSIRLN